MPEVRQRPANVAGSWIDPLFKPASDLEFRFAHLWVELYPEIDLHTEHRFHPTRKFRLDFAHIPSKIGIEIQGGIHTVGAHSTGKGIQRDIEKQQVAATVGWRIIPLSASDLTVEKLAEVAQVILGRIHEPTSS